LTDINGRFSFKTERPAVSTLTEQPLLPSVSSTGVGGGRKCGEMDAGFTGFAKDF
jgi:hypothetical protein